ncbi:IctB family putative bicarbonate transporter [Pseudanabaena sp. PCC 6802]|uniref:IctB family putative bicarbonate transporter n=1 Tax=Pseudanabaena sp. PCC 6802 TaxID=118173 RepID=UPI00034C03B6|nr:IctB family putative bicarbonate transporter [Pseudanabaena sp. PCC 6802]
MDAKLKFTNIKLWQEWWHHSQMRAILLYLGNWQQGSYLVSTSLCGLLLIGLLALLPYLSNNQIGIVSAAIAIYWVFLWVGDRASKAIDAATSVWTPIHLPLAVYWGIASIATMLSPARRAAIDGWVKLTIYFIIFACLNRVMRSSNKIPWRSLLVGTYLLTTVLVCIHGMRQSILGAEDLATWTDPTSELAGTTRIYSFLLNPNLLAGYLLPAIPLGVVGAIHWRSWGVKFVALGVAIAAWYCTSLTYSRAGQIGQIAEGLALLICLAHWWASRLPKWTIPGVLSGAVGAIALALVIFPKQRVRFLSIFFGRNDSSNNFRLNVWMSVLQMIKKKPVLGYGPGNRVFNQIYPYYQRPGYSALGAYSVPLEITFESGIVGLACYIWLVATVIRYGWQNFNRLRAERASEGLWIAASLSIIVGLMAQGLFDTIWYRPQVQIIWWLAIALIASFCIQPIDQARAPEQPSPDSETQI